MLYPDEDGKVVFDFDRSTMLTPENDAPPTIHTNGNAVVVTFQDKPISNEIWAAVEQATENDPGAHSYDLTYSVGRTGRFAFYRSEMVVEEKTDYQREADGTIVGIRIEDKRFGSNARTHWARKENDGDVPPSDSVWDSMAGAWVIPLGRETVLCAAGRRVDTSYDVQNNFRCVKLTL